VAIATGVPAFADEAAELKAENTRLRLLVREHAAGMSFPVVRSKGGESFHEVVITKVTASSVEFTHADGKGSLAATDCPEIWAELFGFSVSSPAASPKAVQQDSAVVQAIAVIEGDRSNGTGFFCRSEGKVYLYTAAHVLSGNSRLQVKLRDGTVVRKFGALEAAEGGDLIRLMVMEDVPEALEIAPETGEAKVGDLILASGNAGGGGTVGFEHGKIVGVGPESIEIDAEVIQGNSGGPILDGKSGRALGVVTHLTVERKDLWAKGTRFSGVRRFGCRLDRHWEWKPMTVDAFLKEGRSLLAIQEQSELMLAALQPAEWNSEVFRRLSSNPLARDIHALEGWMDEQKQGGQRFSEIDRKKRLRGTLESALHRSRSQMEGFRSEGFTWFHRESAIQEIRNRDEIEKVYESSVQDLR
jgi:S1-C subfamily serine protease